MKTPKKNLLSKDEISYVAKLAKLNLPDKLLLKFSDQLSSVIDYMSKIQKLDTENVQETSQVTGLENVMREDEVDRKRIFTQEEALLNAKRKHKGYFMVKAIFEE